MAKFRLYIEDNDLKVKLDETDQKLENLKNNQTAIKSEKAPKSEHRNNEQEHKIHWVLGNHKGNKILWNPNSWGILQIKKGQSPTVESTEETNIHLHKITPTKNSN